MSDLKYIADNFHKLLSDCKDKENYVPPSFTSSIDIEALIVLNQIVQIATEYRLHPKDIKYIVTLETLQRIIHIKCKEFCERPLENYTKTPMFGSTSTSSTFGQKPFVFGSNNYSTSNNYSNSTYSSNTTSTVSNFGVNSTINPVTTNTLQQTPDLEKFKTSFYSFVNTLVEDFLKRIN